MPRERKEFKRESFVRDKQKLYVIATEGSSTEISYFEEFKTQEYCDNKFVFLEVLKRLTTASSPAHVIRQLDSFKKEYRIRDEDELWMVIDRDKQSWKQKQISEVARECYQKRFGFALSNPCFEGWLLLHHKDYNLYSQREKDELFKNAKKGTRSRIEQELINICGSYNKSNLNADHYLPYVQEAITRAESLVSNENERWPSHFGSHVYKLVARLLPKNHIQL